MSEIIRALFIVWALSGITFWVIKKTLPDFLSVKEFKRWRLIWLILVSSCFVANSVWVFIGILACVCIFYVPPKPKDRAIYFLLLLCAVPMFNIEIPGFGSIRFIIAINYGRVLVAFLLCGILIKRLQAAGYGADKIKLFSIKSDIYVVLLVFLMSLMAFRDKTFTDALRESIIHFVEVFVPYFVLSRYLDTKEQLNRAFIALLIGLAPFALMGIFETLKHWHLFVAMKRTISAGRGSMYDVRDGELRASALFASPIVLGYVMVIGFGLLLYLKPLIKNQRYVTLAGFAFIVCVIATMARGTWVGLASLWLVYLWTDRQGVKKIMLWGLSAVALLPFIAVTPLGAKFLNMLPFVGTTRSDTVEYRARLIKNAWIVFKRHPWFGSTTFMQTPEMESMRNGNGLIDLVNTFIGIGLPYGIAGVSLFLAIFLGLLFRCYFTFKRIPQAETDLVRMGRVLFAILASIMVMIGTVSSIDYIAVYYWALAGITAAYISVVDKTIRQYRLGYLAVPS